MQEDKNSASRSQIVRKDRTSDWTPTKTDLPRLIVLFAVIFDDPVVLDSLRSFDTCSLSHKATELAAEHCFNYFVPNVAGEPE